MADSSITSPALASRTYGDGVQPWSAGPLYPWVDETRHNAETGFGAVRFINPDGRSTPWRLYGVVFSMTDATHAAARDARQADALRAANRAIADASNVYDLFAAIIAKDELQLS